MNKIKLLIVPIVTVMLMMLAMPTGVLAQSKEDVCRGVGFTGGQADNTTCDDPTGGTQTVQTIIADVINILSIIVGVVAVIMIIIGGLKYVTSGGDSNSVSSAKNTILYAVIGLVIVLFAQVIVRYVINAAT